MMLSLGRFMSPNTRVSGDPSLKSLIPSCVFDLDATKAASYGGSGQIWANLVPAPADGSAKAAYNFQFGANNTADAADPTFVGSAGSPSAYFSFDGGDSFRLPTNTALLNNLPKTTGGSRPVTLAIAFRAVDENGTKTYFGNISSTPTLRIRINSTENIGIQQGDGTTFVQSNGNGTVTPGQDYVFIASIDAAGNWRTWFNSTTKVTGSMTLVTTTTNGGRFELMSGANNGARLYAVSMFNAFIDNAEAAKIIAAYNTRHGRIYA